MTGCTGTAPSADHGWLAKVLAGDRLACGLLGLARSLSEPEWDAFARRCEQILAETPTIDPIAQGSAAGRHRPTGLNLCGGAVLRGRPFALVILCRGIFARFAC